MKYIKHILLPCIASLALLAGCEKIETVTMAAPEDIVAPVLNYTHGDITVTENNTTAEAHFTWTAADFGIQASIHYSLYLKKGGRTTLITSINGKTEVGVKYAALNMAALRTGSLPGEETGVAVYLEASIGSGDPVTSNTVTVNITPIEMTPPALHLAGTVLGDPTWSDDNYTFIFFRDENVSENEVMTANLLAGEFKLIPDNIDGTKGRWALSYGNKGGKLTSDNGANIAVSPAGYYTIVANLSTLEYSVKPYDATGKPTYTSVTFGDAILTQTAYDAHMWTAENVRLTSGTELRFITGTGVQFGAAGFPYGKATQGGDAVLTREGNYFVKFSDLTGHYVFYETINPNDITPPTLQPPTETEITVSASNRSDKLTLTWSAANFNGVTAGINYTLYLRMGSNEQSIGATTDLSFEVAYSTLNDAALAAGATAGTAATVEIYVKATFSGASRDSDPVTVSITPAAFDYPDKIYMIGQAFGNWAWNSPDVAELLPSAEHPDIFTWTGELTANSEFKWGIAKTWDTKQDFPHGYTDGVMYTYTYTGCEVANNGKGNASVASTDNYTITITVSTDANTDKWHFDVVVAPVTIETPNDAVMPDLTVDNTAINMASADPAATRNFSWTAATGFGADADAAMSYTLYARINSNTAVAEATTALILAPTYAQLNAAALAAGATVGTAGDVQFFVKAAAPGNKGGNSDTVTINITPKALYPDNVYMTGVDFGSWNWGHAGVVEMIPVYGHKGQFWCVRYFTAGNGFKWNTVKDWGGDFNSLGTDVGFTIDNSNAVVAASGFYSVYIDYTTNTITVEPARVFGMGECFGSWDKGQYPFTVDGTVMKITTTNTENLRMYAASSGAPAEVDWWHMEFIILDGNIVYRGTGGDQQPVQVSAGKTVTLDFNAGTGTIE
jgi:hypothetical protein